jgi:hypothetical protein
LGFMIGKPIPKWSLFFGVYDGLWWFGWKKSWTFPWIIDLPSGELTVAIENHQFEEVNKLSMGYCQWQTVRLPEGKGNFTGLPHRKWENLWFPVKIFP